MAKDILVIPDIHCIQGRHNNRADLLSRLILDVKPDIVVNIGDQFDMSSLSSYDKGKRNFHGKRYSEDISAGVEFSDRLWSNVKKGKKKLPRRIFLEGNHEQRIERALDLSPELQGTIGFSDYQLDNYYTDVVRYSGGTPGIIEVEGILFAHYFVSGIMGRPISGKHPAASLLDFNKHSSVQGHTHTLDYSTVRTQGGKTIHAVVTGCFMDYSPEWAGNTANFWRRGVSLLSNVEDGNFDYSWISLDSLKSSYPTGGGS